MTDAPRAPAFHAPLDGLKVLDLSQNLPGPYATFLLGGWGADVVKLEPPKGDPGRHIEPFFQMINRGKRSVALDLREEASRPTLEALIRWADVLVEGFRPGVVDRLGCGPESARALNPRLVYCSISAFGQDGPWRAHPGHDLNLQALSGVCHLERDDKGAPRGSMLPVADLSSSLLAVSSICAALTQRDRTGEGATLDVAMADGAASWANVWGVGVDLARGAEREIGDNPWVRGVMAPLLAHLERAKLYALPHYGCFECKGGGWLALGIVDEGHFWSALADELGLGPLGKLPMPARIASGPVLRPVVARRLRTRTREDWMQRFLELGVPASPVLTPEEAISAPALSRRPFVRAEGGVASPLPGARAPAGRAPKLGEHTEELLAELGVPVEASA